jgi:lipid-A-disaccharide synthase-like uncharacterized protein
MTGLPRTKDATRPQEAWSLVVLGGIEKLTYALQRGDPFSEAALTDMRALARRLEAFKSALERREDVIED